MTDDPRPRAPMPVTRPRAAPPYFHVLTKPTGAICNLDCKYCFFLSKEALYPDSRSGCPTRCWKPMSGR